MPGKFTLWKVWSVTAHSSFFTETLYKWTEQEQEGADALHSTQSHLLSSSLASPPDTSAAAELLSELDEATYGQDQGVGYIIY